MADNAIVIATGVTLILRPTSVQAGTRMSADEAFRRLLPLKSNVAAMHELAAVLPPPTPPRSDDELLHEIATGVEQGRFLLQVSGASCNDAKNNRSRFFEQLPGIYALAQRLNVPSDYLVGLASYESGWFDDHNVRLNNLWGLTQGGGNNIQFHGSPQASTDYFENKVGPYIKNVTTIKDFFDGLKKEGYNSANPDYFNLDPKKGDLANRIGNIGKWKSRCFVK